MTRSKDEISPNEYDTVTCVHIPFKYWPAVPGDRDFYEFGRSNPGLDDDFNFCPLCV